MTLSLQVSVSVPPEIHQLHREYLAGSSIDTLAAGAGISPSTLRNRFRVHRLPVGRSGGKTTRKAAEVREAARREREAIWNMYREHGTIDDVVKLSGYPRIVVVEIIDELPNREQYRRRGSQAIYTRADLLEALRIAAEASGGRLTLPDYRRLAKEMRLPSYDTVVSRFVEESPEHPWIAACEAAGVLTGSPRAVRTGTYSAEDCVDAVERCFRDLGGKVPYVRYNKWASDRAGEPSGITVRHKIGYAAATAQALARLS